MLTVILEDERTRPLTVELEHFAIQIVMIFEQPLGAKQDGQKAERRNEISSTLKHAVSGVASRRPSGPHIHDQYIAETSNATGEIPIPRPTMKGSTNCAAT